MQRTSRSLACASTQHILPDWLGCGCKGVNEDAVTHGQGYCGPPGATFDDRMQQSPTTFVLVGIVVALWVLKGIAYGGNACCSTHASKVYVFQ